MLITQMKKHLFLFLIWNYIMKFERGENIYWLTWYWLILWLNSSRFSSLMDRAQCTSKSCWGFTRYVALILIVITPENLCCQKYIIGKGRRAFWNLWVRMGFSVSWAQNSKYERLSKSCFYTWFSWRFRSPSRKTWDNCSDFSLAFTFNIFQTAIVIELEIFWQLGYFIQFQSDSNSGPKPIFPSFL